MQLIVTLLRFINFLTIHVNLGLCSENNILYQLRVVHNFQFETVVCYPQLSFVMFQSA